MEPKENTQINTQEIVEDFWNKYDIRYTMTPTLQEFLTMPVIYSQKDFHSHGLILKDSEDEKKTLEILIERGGQKPRLDILFKRRSYDSLKKLKGLNTKYPELLEPNIEESQEYNLVTWEVSPLLKKVVSSTTYGILFIDTTTQNPQKKYGALQITAGYTVGYSEEERFPSLFVDNPNTI